MLELFALLLPVAAASGWLAASHHYQRKNALLFTKPNSSRTVLVKGLNYYLNEKSGQVYDTYSDIFSQHANPTESRIALGNLFRQNGEVERAIEIHQALLSECSLSEEQHARAIFELGMDFMRSGLFDRAEGIFLELKNDRLFGQSANQQLLQIYQQEKEWLKAIDCTRSLRACGKLRRGETVAHFYCELAEEAIRNSNLDLAKSYLTRAFDEGHSVRASLLAARIAILQGCFQEALAILKCSAFQNTNYLEQVVDLMMECYRQLGNLSEQIESLKELHTISPTGELIPIISRLIQERDGVVTAQHFLLDEIRKTPSVQGLRVLMDLLYIDPPNEIKSILGELRQISTHLVREAPKYRCMQCGFSGMELHWRCPSCHHWESLVRISEAGVPDAIC